ncbi:hypothetical protein CE91St41_07110 [Oscillospiraceae bacterium]|nr:hypothetical protein CE91St40_07110 [Oscillospiraceae bacterium]BDF73822.1 hypothetical protein CE91St41_07110 [Oscillospiraceae bacterium]
METQQEQFGPRLVEQLREQVSNLMAASQLLTPAIREQPERRYDQYLAILNQSLYRLLRLMNSVECAQRMERDGAQALFRPEVLDLAGLCRELGAQVTPLAERAGVAFRCEADRETLLTTGDGALLQEMLLHLISNALRAAGPGGEAGLRLAAGRGRAVLTVWDSGAGAGLPGAPEAAQDRDGLGAEPGLGLGIPLARQIAALHGGALVFERREERGLRAVVSLPVSLPEKADTLRSPRSGFDATGGFSRTLVELSGVLPYGAFLPEDLE